MKRTTWPSLVIGSVLALLTATAGAVRPHYGGTVRVMVREAPASVEPATLAAWQNDHISTLIFEGLTGFDSRSHLQPKLATRWQSDSQYRHWQFWLRSGVTFQDGSPLTPDALAAALRSANSQWQVSVAADSVIIETDNPTPNMPAVLALPENAISNHTGGKLSGTGPFQVAAWQPGKRLVLSAFEGYWGGRPFADSLEITMGQAWRQQLIALELGRADVVEVAPQQVRRATLDGKRIFTSAPNQLVAVVFARDPQSEEERHVRQSLSAIIDRAAIRNVLLQGQGEVAQTVLPNWMSGYAFLFTTPTSSPQPTVPLSAPTLTLSYDPSDPTMQLIAQRVALNGRDAGVNLQPLAAPASTDARLVTITLPSPNPQTALAAVARAAGLAPQQFQGSSPEELYAQEQQLLQSGRIIPLIHVPQAVAIAPNLNSWQEGLFGNWDLADVWLGGAKP